MKLLIVTGGVGFSNFFSHTTKLRQGKRLLYVAKKITGFEFTVRPHFPLFYFLGGSLRNFSLF